VISAGAADSVTIRGISINGLGPGAGSLDGIRILSAGEVHVEHVQIFGFTGKAIDAIPSNSGSELYVKDSTFRDNTGGGITLLPAQPYIAVVEHTTIERNLFGIRAGSKAIATVTDCDVSRNINNGLLAIADPGQFAMMNINSTLVSHQGAAGVHSEGSGAAVRISNVSVFGNGTGLEAISSGQIISFGNNHVDSNGTNGSPTSTIGPS